MGEPHVIYIYYITDEPHVEMVRVAEFLFTFPCAFAQDDLVAAVGEPAGFPEAIAAEQKMAQQGEEEEEDTSEQSPEVFAAPAHDYMEPIEEPETPCLTVDDMTETMRLSANVKELPHDDDAKEEQPGSG